MSKQLRDVNPGCRVYIPLLGDNVLYEVQAEPLHRPVHDINVVSEEDGTVHRLPCQIQVVICEEDDVMHEYSSTCMCADCTERRDAWQAEEEE